MVYDMSERKFKDARKRTIDAYVNFMRVLEEQVRLRKEENKPIDDIVNEIARALIELIPVMQRELWAARRYIEDLERTKQKKLKRNFHYISPLS